MRVVGRRGKGHTLGASAVVVAQSKHHQLQLVESEVGVVPQDCVVGGARCAQGTCAKEHNMIN